MSKPAEKGARGDRRKAGPGRRARSRDRDSGRRLEFSARNYAFLGAGIVAITVGYLLLAQGSITLAPILLILGYCVLIPVAIVLR